MKQILWLSESGFLLWVWRRVPISVIVLEVKGYKNVLMLTFLIHMELQ